MMGGAMPVRTGGSGRPRRRPRRGPRRLVAAAAVVGVSMAGSAARPALPPSGLRAQEAPKPPTAVADEYLRGIEALAWRATAQRIHPDALAELRDFLRIQIESDRTGEILSALSGGRPAEAYLSLDGGSLFVSVMRALERRSPGIVNAMSARRTDVLGAVAEGDTLRHAVYRLHWDLSGAVPEIKVLTLARDARSRWRVLEAPELASIRPAIQGIRPPPPPPPGAGPP